MSKGRAKQLIEELQVPLMDSTVCSTNSLVLVGTYCLDTCDLAAARTHQCLCPLLPVSGQSALLPDVAMEVVWGSTW